MPALATHELRAVGLAEAQGKLEDCIAGRGQRIFIAGDSGAGKTRFLSEIATRAVRMGMTVVTAECAAMSGDTSSARPNRDSSLHALRPLLREVADQCRNSPDLIGALLAGRGGLLARYEPALHGLDPAPEPPALTTSAARARLLAAVRDTMLALSQKKPLLLLFDDLQWMDELSFELISSLSPTLLASSRVLIVGAYRAESAKPQLTAAAHTIQWQLGRLATDAIVAMVRDMLAVDPLPSLLRDTVVAHAGGSPLFAAEYLRLAIANGQLVRSSSAGWRFRSQSSADAGRTALPRTLEEIIRLRLDRLSTSAKQIAEIASVLGRSFQAPELISACGNQRELVLLAIQELIYVQVFEADAGQTLRFVHDKLPETIYARLPLERRRELHATAVRALEASHGDADMSARYAELAFHWQQAGQPEQAAQYWARAGAQALKATAYFDAVQHFEAALRNALDTEGSCWVRSLKYERAREHLERARSLLEQAPEWVCQLRSYAQLAHAHFGMGRRPQAVALAASGLDVLRQHQGPPLLVSSIDAVMSLAHVHIELWRERATDVSRESLAREALAYLARLALVFPVARAYYLLCAGRFHATLGRKRRAQLLLVLAERSANALQLPYEQALIAWHRAQLFEDERAHWEERARQYFAKLGNVVTASMPAPG